MEISLRGSSNGERGETGLQKWQDLKTHSGFSRHPKEDDRWWVSKCASIMGEGTQVLRQPQKESVRVLKNKEEKRNHMVEG